MKLHKHFLPHLYQESHHRAHLISNSSLFVYLQILLVFGTLLFSFKVKYSQVLGEITFSPTEIVNLTNIQRGKNGLGTLTENSLLDQAAQAKASDMFANDYWAHYSPSGKSPWVFITGAGYKYVYAGENLARDFDNAKSVVDAWMNSPSHRANLLDHNFKEIGVAVADGKLNGRDGILVVQMFGSTNASVPVALPENKENEIAQSTVQGEQVNTEPVINSKPVMFPPRFDLARSISLALVAFVFLLFLVEALVSLKSAHLKLQPQVIAHLLLLGLSILVLWYSASGAII